MRQKTKDIKHIQCIFEIHIIGIKRVGRIVADSEG